MVKRRVRGPGKLQLEKARRGPKEMSALGLGVGIAKKVARRARAKKRR